MDKEKLARYNWKNAIYMNNYGSKTETGRFNTQQLNESNIPKSIMLNEKNYEVQIAEGLENITRGHNNIVTAMAKEFSTKEEDSNNKINILMRINEELKRKLSFQTRSGECNENQVDKWKALSERLSDELKIAEDTIISLLHPEYQAERK